MDLTNFEFVFSLIQSHGYALLFILLLIEGPVATAAGAFAASLGAFNIYLVFILAILGDLLADFMYFLIGRLGHDRIYKKESFLGIKKKRIEEMNRHLNNHFGKGMLLIKFTPLLAPPGLIAIGASKIRTVRFTTIALLITLPKVLSFMFIGYYYGLAFDKLANYVTWTQYLIVIFVILLIITPIILRWFLKKFINKIEEKKK